jgi:hypothetical protein
LKINKILVKIAKKICKWFPCLEPYAYKYARSKAKRSKGEVLVANWLKDNNIKYQEEYLIKFPYIVRKKPFVFIDFYLPEHNIFIEYNGKQHYEYVPYFHKSKGDFERQQSRDRIVRSYCKEQGIKLIEIPYWLKDNEVKNLLNDQVFIR